MSMKKTRKFLCIILSVLMITGTLNLLSFAKDATTGKLGNVIVCVRFADDTSDRFATETDRILKLYNDTTDLYSYMPYDYSFKAYINEISRGLLDVENTFPQYDGEKIVPLTLHSTLKNSTDTSVLQEVIGAFNDGRITLPSGKYDYRTTGMIDNLTVILQCTSDQAEQSVTWPHKSICDVTTKINGTYYVGNYNFINSYSLLDSVTQQGTVSHEFLHTVGLPDLYRKGGMSGVPVGRWDIMASNSMYQQYPLSYLRYKMGWVPMQTISQSGDYTLDPVSDSDSDRILYKIETPMSNTEFFVVEFRYKNPDYGYYDSKRFEARLPSSGMIIYRVNTAIEYQTNFGGEDYLYVFRPDDTSLTASAGDVTAAAINPLEGETSYGSADMSASLTDNTIFYSDGKNSGLVISNVTCSTDGKKLSFHIEYPDYSSLDLWDNVGSSLSTGTSQTQGTADDNGNMYVLSTGMVNNTFVTNVYKFTNGAWIKAANTLSGVNDAYIQTYNNELYMIYLNSSWYPVIAKLENGAWKTIVTDKSTQYPNNPSLFKSENGLYCSWVKDGTNLVIKKVNGTGLTAVNSSLTASYFSNPAITVAGDYIYAIYSDFFGADTYTKLKRYSISGGYWEEMYIPNPISYSNVHRAAYNNGEVWFLAAGMDSTPIVLSVKENGEVIQKTVPTSITNFLYIGLDVNESGTLYVGLFTAQSSSEVLYLENGEWKKLGSNPCDAIQAADMFVYKNRVYVPSSALSSGSLVVRSKEMPELAVAQIIAKEGTGIEIRDGFVIGVPANAVDLSLYLDTTEDGTYTYSTKTTGSEIYLYSSDNVLVKIYKIVVCGDVNADSSVDGQDSVLIGAVINSMAGFTDAQLLAADADRSGIVDNNDYNLTADAGVLIS